MQTASDRKRIRFLILTPRFNFFDNAGVLAREGLGYVLTFDKLINVGADSVLCFRPLTPALATKMYVVWKKYQVFTRAAEVLLGQLQRSLLSAANSK